MPVNSEFLRKIYNELGRESLKQSTIHGLHIFTYKTKLEKGRKIWFVFMLVLFIWTHYVVINLTIIHLRQPTEIHMSPVMVHVSNIPFPSIAICSANKFSKRKMQDFADKIFEIQQRLFPNLMAQTSQEMAQHLLLLAGFYLYPYDNYDIRDKRLEHLQMLLAEYFHTDEYPSRELLRHLAPDCENLVIRAQVFGKSVPPMELFATRMTSSSICCIFNYKRESYSTNSTYFPEPNVQKLRNVTFEAGTILNSIQVVLQSDVDDFTYRELSNDAFRLFIVPPAEYPLMESRISDIFVEYNTIVDVPIEPIFLDGDDSIKGFPPSTRKCYFPLEGQRLLNLSYYSFDECLMVCRMRSQMRHCGCVNPSMPAKLVNGRYCSLLDFPCLTQWKNVWYMRVSDMAYDSMDNDELTSAVTVECDYCLPSCDTVNYDIFVNELPIRKATNGSYTAGILKGLNNDKPLAIVRLYFRRPFARANMNVIVSDWVVLLNRFGGIMSFMYGFGLVSIIEFIYFASGKFFSLFTRRALEDREQQAVGEIHTPADYKLYWKELNPRAPKPRLALKSFK